MPETICPICNSVTYGLPVCIACSENAHIGEKVKLILKEIDKGEGPTISGLKAFLTGIVERAGK